jgi:hypothetical protein
MDKHLRISIISQEDQLRHTKLVKTSVSGLDLPTHIRKADSLSSVADVVMAL